MISNKKIWFIILAAVVMIFSFKIFNSPNKEYMLRVGVSDDTSTLVINHMIDNKGKLEIEMQDFVEKYTISDC